jgi:hypothetical protein
MSARTTTTHDIGCLAYMAVLLLATSIISCGGAIGSGLRSIGTGLRERSCECAP